MQQAETFATTEATAIADATTNSTTSSASVDDTIVVVFWTVLLGYGLVTNAIVLAAILHTRSLRTPTSYWMVISLSICDMVMIVVSISHLLPATALHDAFVTLPATRNYVAIFCYNIFWYSGMVGLAAMAVNRFANIMFPMHYNTWFSQERTVLLLILCYLIGVGVSLPTLFPCCRTVYDHTGYVTMFLDGELGPLYGYFDLAFATASVLVMIVCYACIIWRVRKSRLSTQRHRLGNEFALFNGSVASSSSAHSTGANQRIRQREMRLFVQFFVVSLVFALTFTTWQAVFRVSGDSKWACFAMTSLFFVNNAINPTVYLLFNTNLRRAVQKMFCPPASPTRDIVQLMLSHGHGGKSAVTPRPRTSSTSCDDSDVVVAASAQQHSANNE